MTLFFLSTSYISEGERARVLQGAPPRRRGTVYNHLRAGPLHAPEVCAVGGAGFPVRSRPHLCYISETSRGAAGESRCLAWACTSLCNPPNLPFQHRLTGSLHLSLHAFIYSTNIYWLLPTCQARCWLLRSRWLAKQTLRPPCSVCVCVWGGDQ